MTAILLGLLGPLAAQVDPGSSTTTAPGGGGTLLLGDDLLPSLVLAIGAAMLVGTVLALVRPRPDALEDDEEGEEGDEGEDHDGDPVAAAPGGDREGDLARPPLVRSLVFAGIGLVGVVWGLGTLLA